MPTSTTSEESQIDNHSNRALARTRRNLHYLYSPSTSPTSPSSRRTRVFLRLIRSSLIFVFWRLVRYAKYVAIGSLIATLGAGAFGTVVSGAGFVLAPTGIMGTVLAGSVWGVGRVVLRRVGRRWDRGGVMEEDEDEEMGVDEGRGFEVDAMPW
ncbi:hypothetical protein FB567DRAFT_565341 [Paraphoma chrysanthemicola]|uniref:Transmembrane protein n=1 Tax=Paraphoma chrysanthemicola TaxID=798071 RepID=A0A8K0QSY6_9PLEO|nr:hypothetical protein FB567DRAFT_565341 [Paraphoma chrysanthemicola]